MDVRKHFYWVIAQFTFGICVVFILITCQENLEENES